MTTIRIWAHRLFLRLELMYDGLSRDVRWSRNEP
jgi:hypothetical protein